MQKKMSKEHSPKEKAIYQAVMELFEEGADLNSLTVSEITGRAGIGKGTAYEYFSDKEEMITKAIYYSTKEMCLRISERLKKEKSLYDKVNLMLVKMEQQVTETSCMMRMIHVMSDTSAISRRLREMEKEQEEEERPVVELIKGILADESKEEKKPAPEKLSYLIMSILSKVLCYGILIRDDFYMSESGRESMRDMICCGICREVREMLP